MKNASCAIRMKDEETKTNENEESRRQYTTKLEKLPEEKLATRWEMMWAAWETRMEDLSAVSDLYRFCLGFID
jgi:hypothetical protein